MTATDVEIIEQTNRITRFLTVSRLLWVLVSGAVIAMSSAAGCLYGEGRMRGAFQGTVEGNGQRIDVLGNRITALETAREGDRATWAALLSRVSSIDGSLNALLKVWPTNADIKGQAQGGVR